MSLKKRTARFSNRLIAIVVALFGITACHVEEVGGSTNTPTPDKDKPTVEKPGGFDDVCVYGTPTAAYYIEGLVKDIETNEPLGDIEVTFVEEHFCDTTDGNGRFSISREYGWPRDTFRLRLRDVAQNREVRYLDEEYKIEKYDFKDGDGGWYVGKLSLDLKLDMFKEGDFLNEEE